VADAADRRVDRLGGRQALPAHARGCAVRADEQVAHGPAPVGEDGGDAPVGLVLVADELRVEPDRIGQAGQQQRAQHPAVGRVVVLGRPGGTPRVHGRLVDHDKFPELLGEQAEVAGRPRGRDERLPRPRRQQGVQRPAAGGVDMEAVAGRAALWSWVALVHLHGHAGTPQSVGQRQTADAAARDDHS